MMREFSVEIEQEAISYDPHELVRWRTGDPTIVPPQYLNRKGPGFSNGYGYVEYFVQRHLEENHFNVIANDFNLFTMNSKYHENNKRIEDSMGVMDYHKLQAILNRMYQAGIRIENPDLCILKPSLFFAEVKRGRDQLREPQIAFAIVFWELFRIPFKVYKLLPDCSNYYEPPIIYLISLPDEVFSL